MLDSLEGNRKVEKAVSEEWLDVLFQKHDRIIENEKTDEAYLVCLNSINL